MRTQNRYLKICIHWKLPNGCIWCPVYEILVQVLKEYTSKLFSDVFDVQCMKFWYKFSNNTLPNYFRSMFQYNSSLYDTETRNHDRMHVFQPERLVHVTSCDIASQN